jgi:hypothetical protein
MALELTPLSYGILVLISILTIYYGIIKKTSEASPVDWYLVTPLIGGIIIGAGLGYSLSPTEVIEEKIMVGGENGHGNGHGGGGHAEVPPEYKGLKNEYSWVDMNVVAEGKEIYEKNYCFVCHGRYGDGKGPMFKGMDPPPANFTERMMVAMLAQDYWFWRIHDGGQNEQFNSSMPEWHGVLTEDEIWKVVTYEHFLSGHLGPHTPEAHPELFEMAGGHAPGDGEGHAMEGMQMPGEDHHQEGAAAHEEAATTGHHEEATTESGGHHN